MMTISSIAMIDFHFPSKFISQKSKKKEKEKSLIGKEYGQQKSKREREEDLNILTRKSHLRPKQGNEANQEKLRDISSRRCSKSEKKKMIKKN